MTFSVLTNEKSAAQEKRALQIMQAWGWQVPWLSGRAVGDGKDLADPIDGLLIAPGTEHRAPFEMKCRESISKEPVDEVSFMTDWKGEWLVTESKRFETQRRCVAISNRTGRPVPAYWILFLPLSDVVYIGKVCTSLQMGDRWTSEWLLNPTKIQRTPTDNNSTEKRKIPRLCCYLRVAAPEWTRLHGTDPGAEADAFAREAA